jgi:hypothetical protein
MKQKEISLFDLGDSQDLVLLDLQLTWWGFPRISEVRSVCFSQSSNLHANFTQKHPKKYSEQYLCTCGPV